MRDWGAATPEGAGTWRHEPVLSLSKGCRRYNCGEVANPHVNLTPDVTTRHSKTHYLLSLTTCRKAHVVAGETSSRKPSSKSKGPLDTEILTVHVEREGQQVSAKWGLNPRLKEELTPDEWERGDGHHGKSHRHRGETVFGNVDSRADGNRRNRVSPKSVLQPPALAPNLLSYRCGLTGRARGEIAALVFDQDPFARKRGDRVVDGSRRSQCRWIVRVKPAGSAPGFSESHCKTRSQTKRANRTARWWAGRCGRRRRVT